MVVVVVLRSRRVKLFVGFLMIGFLEQDIGSDFRFLELAVVFDAGRGDIYVDAADRAVLMLDRVDGLDTFEDIVNGIVHRIFAGFDREALVAHVLKGDNFLGDFFLGELLSRNMSVLSVIRTVDAAVDTVVGQIQRREHNDTVAVEILLDLFRQIIHFLEEFRVVAGQEHRGFPMAQSLAQRGLVEDLPDERVVVLIGVCVSERFHDFFV